jgi:hypothetical protein
MRSCENRFVPSIDRVSSEVAEIPFDNILDRVTGSDPSVTDSILEQSAKCLSAWYLGEDSRGSLAEPVVTKVFLG